PSRPVAASEVPLPLGHVPCRDVSESKAMTDGRARTGVTSAEGVGRGVPDRIHAEDRLAVLALHSSPYIDHHATAGAHRTAPPAPHTAAWSGEADSESPVSVRGGRPGAGWQGWCW